jgi:hypothetical protein
MKATVFSKLAVFQQMGKLIVRFIMFLFLLVI